MIVAELIAELQKRPMDAPVATLHEFELLSNGTGAYVKKVRLISERSRAYPYREKDGPIVVIE